MTYENGDKKRNAPWWTSPAVVTSVAGFLLVQGGAILIWGTKLDSRVGNVELRQGAAEIRANKLDEAFSKIGIMDERQQSGQTALNNVVKKIDDLVIAIGLLRDETLRARPLPPVVPVEPLDRRRR